MSPSLILRLTAKEGSKMKWYLNKHPKISDCLMFNLHEDIRGFI